AVEGSLVAAPRHRAGHGWPACADRRRQRDDQALRADRRQDRRDRASRRRGGVLRATGARGRRGVAITGIGLVTPVGNDVATTWEALLAGRSGGAPIAGFDAS